MGGKREDVEQSREKGNRKRVERRLWKSESVRHALDQDRWREMTKRGDIRG